jgi:hypothetical protein
MTLSIAGLRRVGLINDVVERKQRLCLIYELSQHCLQGPRKTIKPAVTIAYVAAGIRIKHHPNTRQERYGWTNLLSVSVALIQTYFTSLKLYLHRRELTILGTMKAVLIPFAAEEIQSGHAPLRCGASHCH